MVKCNVSSRDMELILLSVLELADVKQKSDTTQFCCYKTNSNGKKYFQQKILMGLKLSFN